MGRAVDCWHCLQSNGSDGWAILGDPKVQADFTKPDSAYCCRSMASAAIERVVLIRIPIERIQAQIEKGVRMVSSSFTRLKRNNLSLVAGSIVAAFQSCQLALRKIVILRRRAEVKILPYHYNAIRAGQPSKADKRLIEAVVLLFDRSTWPAEQRHLHLLHLQRSPNTNRFRFLCSRSVVVVSVVAATKPACVHSLVSARVGLARIGRQDT